MTSSEDTADRPKPTPIYEQPVEVEGQYPPVVGLRELRHLLNAGWADVNQVSGPSQPDPAYGQMYALRGQNAVLLAQAELMYRQAVDDEQRRAGRLVGRDFERQTVPLEYVDAFVRRTVKDALEEGRRQGRIEAHVEVGEKLAAISAVVPVDANDPVRQILSGDTVAAEYIARIERAAYDRGLQVAGDHARRDFDEVRSDQANLRQQLIEIRAALGMSPDEDHNEVVSVIGLYRDIDNQYSSALAKLTRIREVLKAHDDGACEYNGHLEQIREVLES